MKTFLRSLSAGIAAACLLASSPAFAAVALIPGSNILPQNQRVIAYGDVTAASTFATTAYADLPGSSITFTPSLNDETTAARITPGLIEVDWTVDATKATSTTGVCAVFVNGAIVASSARTVGAVTEDIIGGSFIFANTTVGAQTVKLQCKSGDTAVFTVNFGHVIYREIVPAYSH